MIYGVSCWPLHVVLWNYDITDLNIIVSRFCQNVCQTSVIYILNVAKGLYLMSTLSSPYFLTLSTTYKTVK